MQYVRGLVTQGTYSRRAQTYLFCTFRLRRRSRRPQLTLGERSEKRKRNHTAPNHKALASLSPPTWLLDFTAFTMMCLHPVTEPPEMGESLFFFSTLLFSFVLAPPFHSSACSTLRLWKVGPLVMSDPPLLTSDRSLVCFAPPPVVVVGKSCSFPDDILFCRERSNGSRRARRPDLQVHPFPRPSPANPPFPCAAERCGFTEANAH